MRLASVEQTSARSFGQYITVDGTRLHYVNHGTGTPVILLHGNGSMVGDFISSGIVEQLGRGYRVVAFDRPVAPSLDLHVDLLVQLADRARADSRAPQGFGNVFDSPYAHSRKIHLHQRFFH